jgi:hypothetical protein
MAATATGARRVATRVLGFGQIQVPGRGLLAPPRMVTVPGAPLEGVDVSGSGGVAAGASTAAALASDGRQLWVLGAGHRGELGLGHGVTETAAAVRVTLPRGALAAAASGGRLARVVLGPATTALVTGDGRLFTCGEGRDGALGLGGRMGAVGSYHGGQQPDALFEPREIGGLPPVADVALSAHFSLVLAADGGVYACGSGFHGQLGLGATSYATAPTRVPGLPGPGGDDDPVAAIAAGGGFSLAATRSGRLFFWGRIGAGGRAGVVGAPAAAGDGGSGGARPEPLWFASPTELPLPGVTPLRPLAGPLRLAAGLQHALITDGARLWLLGYYSTQPVTSSSGGRGPGGGGTVSSPTAAARAAARDALRSSAHHHLRELDVAAVLGRAPASLGCIACGPSTGGVVADGTLLLAGRLTALAHRPGVGDGDGSDGAAAHFPAFSESLLVTLSPSSPGEPGVTAIALGASHGLVAVADAPPATSVAAAAAAGRGG